MDAKRKQVLISLITAATVGAWLYFQLSSWPSLSTSEVGKLLVKTIGISIVAHIINTIVITIVVGLLGGRIAKDVTDERDAAIELQAMRAILVGFSMGLVIIFALVGWCDLVATSALLAIFLCMYAANVAGDLLKLYWYR
tara:strand:- start:321 stop:740 length:420 start_codon:yes stop_codon:yes gene_type:complete